MSEQNKAYHPKDFEKKRYLRDIRLLSPLRQEKTQQYALLVFTILSLSVFGLFAINPTITTILELRRKLEDSELVNQQLDKKISDMSILQQQYSSLESDLPAIYAAIPENPDVAILLGQLQAIATEENITILDLQSFSSPIQADKKPIKTTPKEDPAFEFALEVTGSYEAMQQFLAQLTSFERIVTVTGITIGKDGNIETAPLTMTIRGKAYYQYENE